MVYFIILVLPRGPICEWIINNLYWIVPSLFSFLAIIGVLITTIIQVNNVKKNTIIQIEKASINNKEQIEALKESTKKQIENQNREGKRPLISIKEYYFSNTGRMDYYLRPKNYDGANKSYYQRNYHIKLKNVGYGVAQNLQFLNIKIIDAPDKYYLTENSSFQKGEIDEAIFITDLNKNETIEINFEVDFISTYKANKDSLLRLILEYSDLSENYYQSLFIVGIDCDYHLCHHFHLKGTEAYKKQYKKYMS